VNNLSGRVRGRVMKNALAGARDITRIVSLPGLRGRCPASAKAGQAEDGCASFSFRLW